MTLTNTLPLAWLRSVVLGNILGYVRLCSVMDKHVNDCQRVIGCDINEIAKPTTLRMSRFLEFIF